MVTRKDVAKLAGVSPTSVSYVLNNSGYVSKENREKIEKAIEALGYRPNNIARSLKTKKTNLFVIIVNEIRNEFFANVAYSMEQYLSQYGYTLLVYNTRDDEKSLENLINYQVDGVFVYSKKMSIPMINMFPQNGIPTVIASNTEHEGLDPSIIQIHIDTFGGVKQAVHYLIQNGHTRIAYFNAINNPRNTYRDIRLDAYRLALNEDNIEYDERLVYSLSNQCNIKSLVIDLCNRRDATAFIGSNDNIAIGILSTILSLGMNVPKDFSVVGIGNIGLSSLIYPSLTTVSIPASQIGETAAQILIDMNTNKSAHNIILNTEFIERGSTGPVK